MPPLLSRSFLHNEYMKEQKSLRQIAEATGTNAKAIERMLIKYGIPLRGKSEAQALALKTGRHPGASRNS